MFQKSLTRPIMQSERHPLPFGWVKEFDETSGHPFYVRPTLTVCRRTGC